LGQLFDKVSDQEVFKRVAVIGLGIGTTVTYEKPGSNFDFYEINESVAKLARNNPYFSFLKYEQGYTNIILGDAREKMAEAQDNFYGLIVGDAYFGHDLPKKLFTYESFKLYLKKLNKEGILMMHISNHDLDMRPVVARILREIGVTGMAQSYKIKRSPYDTAEKKELLIGMLSLKNKASNDQNRFIAIPQNLIYWLWGNIAQDHTDSSCDWVAVAKDPKVLQKILSDDSRWQLLDNSVREELWTDKSVG
jgi:hypothetical protein